MLEINHGMGMASRKIDKIIIHCSATPEGRDVQPQEIEKWHKERGFKSIGYHYVITLDGKTHKGRDLEEVGAHCSGQNKNSIGICYVGGCDKYMRPKDTRTREQKMSLIWLIDYLRNKYPGIKIYGHKEYANKECPCFDVMQEYDCNR